jgi:hypothetical protein
VKTHPIAFRFMQISLAMSKKGALFELEKILQQMEVESKALTRGGILFNELNQVALRSILDLPMILFCVGISGLPVLHFEKARTEEYQQSTTRIL